jgi:GTP-binding protein
VQFVDEVTLRVQAGNGGHGAVAFRREKHRPLGGPSGGDGGRGGDVVIEAQTRLSTLYDLRYRHEVKAESGENGRGKDQYGHAGASVILPVPVGTQVYDADTDELIVDLDAPDKRLVIAEGGQGGRGNMHFATPFDRSPRRAEPGEPGGERRLRLELKLLADVGVVGFPNVGKSTFIASVSRARPKIADYPFTTLTPNLGVASLGPERSFVIADIPGIIEGAAEGAGLGLRFLRHVERTRVLLHVLAPDADPGRHPIEDFHLLCRELGTFDASLAGRPVIVALGKMDLPDAQAVFEETREAMAELGHTLYPMSAATGEGVQDVLLALERTLREIREEPVAEPPSKPAEARPHGDEKGFPEPDDQA